MQHPHEQVNRTEQEPAPPPAREPSGVPGYAQGLAATGEDPAGGRRMLPGGNDAAVL